MNFKDRGNKKWTAMMLIDHRDRLKKLKEHEDDREKPILDDQEKAAINSKLQQAIDNNLSVAVKYYEDKEFKTISGTIKKVDVSRRIIIISDKKIPIKNFMGIKLE
jgi:hypothetical protein